MMCSLFSSNTSRHVVSPSFNSKIFETVVTRSQLFPHPAITQWPLVTPPRFLKILVAHAILANTSPEELLSWWLPCPARHPVLSVSHPSYSQQPSPSRYLGHSLLLAGHLTTKHTPSILSAVSTHSPYPLLTPASMTSQPHLLQAFGLCVSLHSSVSISNTSDRMT